MFRPAGRFGRSNYSRTEHPYKHKRPPAGGLFPCLTFRHETVFNARAASFGGPDCPSCPANGCGCRDCRRAEGRGRHGGLQQPFACVAMVNTCKTAGGHTTSGVCGPRTTHDFSIRCLMAKVRCRRGAARSPKTRSRRFGPISAQLSIIDTPAERCKQVRGPRLGCAASGEALAISIPRSKTAVILHSSGADGMPYGLFLPEVLPTSPKPQISIRLNQPIQVRGL